MHLDTVLWPAAKATESEYGWLSAGAMTLIAAFGLFVTWRYTAGRGEIGAGRLVALGALVATVVIALVLLETWSTTNVWGIGFLLLIWLFVLAGLGKTLLDARRKRDS